MEWNEYERRKRRGRSKIRYSTGRSAAPLHSSGTVTDNQVGEELEALQAAESKQRAADGAKAGKKPPQFKNVKAEY